MFNWTSSADWDEQCWLKQAVLTEISSADWNKQCWTEQKASLSISSIECKAVSVKDEQHCESEAALLREAVLLL